MTEPKLKTRICTRCGEKFKTTSEGGICGKCAMKIINEQLRKNKGVKKDESGISYPEPSTFVYL